MTSGDVDSEALASAYENTNTVVVHARVFEWSWDDLLIIFMEGRY